MWNNYKANQFEVERRCVGVNYCAFNVNINGNKVMSL